jgi:hypothetical protein
MRVTIYAAVLLTILCTCPSRAAFITQSQVVNMRFMDAAPGVPAEPEPLRFGAEAADTIVLLDLGEIFQHGCRQNADLYERVRN